MKSVNEYLDDVKRKLKLPSDYKLSKTLNIGHSAISKIRKGGSISDDTALKIANLLEIEPEEIILVATAERCHEPEKAVIWRNILARFETSEEIGNWRARHDSNVRPTGSKPVTLSS